VPEVGRREGLVIDQVEAVMRDALARRLRPGRADVHVAVSGGMALMILRPERVGVASDSSVLPVAVPPAMIGSGGYRVSPVANIASGRSPRSREASADECVRLARSMGP
jgi:hypothetical protein